MDTMVVWGVASYTRPPAVVVISSCRDQTLQQQSPALSAQASGLFPSSLECENAITRRGARSALRRAYTYAVLPDSWLALARSRGSGAAYRKGVRSRASMYGEREHARCHGISGLSGEDVRI